MSYFFICICICYSIFLEECLLNASIYKIITFCLCFNLSEGIVLGKDGLKHLLGVILIQKP